MDPTRIVSAMRQDTPSGTDDGSDPSELPATRPPRGTVVELHDSLARFAAAIAAAGDGQERSLLLRARAESILQAVVRRRSENTTSARTDAQATVTEFAARLRASGIPPERMLVVVKAAVRDVTPGVLSAAEQHTMTADVVRWSIEGYYAA
jgi:hypothetical protein